MAYCDVNGARLAYQQMGTGPDLVLIHGLATNRAFWYATLAQAFKQHRSVLLYDLRGHGYSERTAGGYSAVNQADDLLGLLDHLGIESADIVGHSYGGGVGLELALSRPGRVRRLALLDTKINALQPQQWLSDSDHLSPFEVKVAETAGIDWSLEPQLGLTYLETTARLRVEGRLPGVRDAFTPFGEGRGGLRCARQYLRVIDETRASDEFLEPGASADAIAGLRVPLLLMYGAYSRCLPSGRALQRLLPNSVLHELLDAGHFFPASHAAQVSDMLSKFMDTPLLADAASEGQELSG